MTREEVIAYGNDYYRDLITACCEIDEKHKEFVRMSLEALEKEPRWIPVTERLPEEGTFVLASYNSDEGPDVVMTYHNKYGFTRGLMTAWMPLPEPYEEDKE